MSNKKEKQPEKIVERVKNNIFTDIIDDYLVDSTDQNKYCERIKKLTPEQKTEFIFYLIDQEKKIYPPTEEYHNGLDHDSNVQCLRGKIYRLFLLSVENTNIEEISLTNLAEIYKREFGYPDRTETYLYKNKTEKKILSEKIYSKIAEEGEKADEFIKNDSSIVEHIFNLDDDDYDKETIKKGFSKVFFLNNINNENFNSLLQFNPLPNIYPDKYPYKESKREKLSLLFLEEIIKKNKDKSFFISDNILPFTKELLGLIKNINFTTGDIDKKTEIVNEIYKIFPFKNQDNYFEYFADQIMVAENIPKSIKKDYLKYLDKFITEHNYGDKHSEEIFCRFIKYFKNLNEKELLEEYFLSDKYKISKYFVFDQNCNKTKEFLNLFFESAQSLINETGLKKENLFKINQLFLRNQNLIRKENLESIPNKNKYQTREDVFQKILDQMIEKSIRIDEVSQSIDFFNIYYRNIEYDSIFFDDTDLKDRYIELEKKLFDLFGDDILLISNNFDDFKKIKYNRFENILSKRIVEKIDISKNNHIKLFLKYGEKNTEINHKEVYINKLNQLMSGNMINDKEGLSLLFEKVSDIFYSGKHIAKIKNLCENTIDYFLNSDYTELNFVGNKPINKYHRIYQDISIFHAITHLVSEKTNNISPKYMEMVREFILSPESISYLKDYADRYLLEYNYCYKPEIVYITYINDYFRKHPDIAKEKSHELLTKEITEYIKEVDRVKYESNSYNPKELQELQELIIKRISIKLTPEQIKEELNNKENPDLLRRMNILSLIGE